MLDLCDLGLKALSSLTYARTGISDHDKSPIEIRAGLPCFGLLQGGYLKSIRCFLWYKPKIALRITLLGVFAYLFPHRENIELNFFFAL
ncbi:hypothetical protein CEXT_163711 [Caerostris extrusa]|uniref:Uncharacterized protein n=1 Tax=Caerostris extrusa TaxID=172846 RepID=A0AAV4SIT7_CAEEX|nr:hypothetical protein CEXT_163711 [Caerostris extrusa]